MDEVLSKINTLPNVNKVRNSKLRSFFIRLFTDRKRPVTRWENYIQKRIEFINKVEEKMNTVYGNNWDWSLRFRCVDTSLEEGDFVSELTKEVEEQFPIRKTLLFSLKLTVFFENIVVEDSFGNTHNVEHLYTILYVRLTGQNSFSFKPNLYGFRGRMTLAEVDSNYWHSHINGSNVSMHSNNVRNPKPFCLGESEFGMTLQELSLENDLWDILMKDDDNVEFESFLILMDAFVRNEYTEGAYKTLKSISRKTKNYNSPFNQPIEDKKPAISKIFSNETKTNFDIKLDLKEDYIPSIYEQYNPAIFYKQDALEDVDWYIHYLLPNLSFDEWHIEFASQICTFLMYKEVEGSPSIHRSKPWDSTQVINYETYCNLKQIKEKSNIVLKRVKISETFKGKQCECIIYDKSPNEEIQNIESAGKLTFNRGITRNFINNVNEIVKNQSLINFMYGKK